MIPTDLSTNRMLGQYPLSIATSLAIESATNIHEEVKHKSPPILEYDELWVNIRTMFRNIVGALDKDIASRITPKSIANALLDEMNMLESIINEFTNNKVKVIFYYSNYARLELLYKHALIRMDNTDKQKEFTILHNQTIKIVLDKQTIEKTHDIRVFDLHIKTENKCKALILTNYAFDLLSYNKFNKLTLLESHTGHIKNRAQFYTKYMNGAELSQIPFTLYFLIIFGDSQTFRPFNIKLRKMILDVAKKYNWSAVSTRDKIKYGIEQLKNEYEKQIILEMMHYK